GECVFDLNGGMAFEADFAAQAECCTFAINNVLGNTAECGDPHKQWRQLWMVYQFEVEILFADRTFQIQLHRNHGRRSAQFSRDGSEVVGSNGADCAADVYDFGGSKVGRKCRNNAAACHWDLYVTEAQKRMAAQENLVGLNCGDSACGIDGSVALNQN